MWIVLDVEHRLAQYTRRPLRRPYTFFVLVAPTPLYGTTFSSSRIPFYGHPFFQAALSKARVDIDVGIEDNMQCTD